MNAVVTLPEERQVVTTSDSRAIMSLIERLATSPEVDLARIEKLLELKERWDAGEARKAYVAAMAAFKANPPEILKDKHVKYQTSKGVTEYDHATLGGICSAVITGLSQHGISHRWDVAQADNRIKVTCILTHALGHSESVSLHSAPDDSGGKNSIQAIASAVTYLQRYTLLAATGLAPEDMTEDDDGRRAGKVDHATLSEEQIANLEALLTEVGADRGKYLRYMRVDSLSEILAVNYKTALDALERKRKA